MPIEPSLEAYWKQHTKTWTELAGKLGAFALPAPEDFENSYIGLDAYLQTAGGITHFPAREVVKHSYPWPPQLCWPGALVHCLLAEKMRPFNGGRPLNLRHWYRSWSFNLVRRGAPRSDHLWACAVDLDFVGLWALAVAARRRAQRWLLKESGIEQKVISLGVGWRTLHVGLFAPETLKAGCHRRWKYGKLPTTEKLYS